MPADRAGDPADEPGAEHEGFRPPLPPEDRLWRHPSEVARERAAQGKRGPLARAAGGAIHGGPPPSRTAAFMLASGMIGATLAVAAVALLGGFDSSRTAAPAVRGLNAPTVTGLTRQPGSVGELAERTAAAVTALRVEGSADRVGSAIAYGAEGHLLTSASLIAGSTSVVAFLPDGRSLPGTVVGTDPATDVAVVQLDVDDLPPAPLGSADTLEVGAGAVAVAAVSDHGWQRSMSSGVVSAVGRRLEARDGTTLYDMILVDAASVPGVAGSAIVDADGQVVGVASAMTAKGPDAARFVVVTPIDLVRHVADHLIADGSITHGWLGIRGVDLPAEAAMRLGLAGAVRISGLAEAGPAEAAGLRADDVITAVDDSPVRSMAELIARLHRRVAGEQVELEVHRDGETLVLDCTLAPKPG